MLQLALLFDGPARKYREEFEDKVEAVITSSAARVAQARFSVYGANEYPDATFTARLSYGPVKGLHQPSRARRCRTTRTFAGLYKHATGQRTLPASGAMDQGEVCFGSEYAVRLRDHCRHSWRQFGQPYRQRKRRAHRDSVRWQTGRVSKTSYLYTDEQARIRAPGEQGHPGSSD